MLAFIRKRSGGIISIVIVGAIALVFVFWGIGGQNTGDAITIYLDDEAVPITEFLEIKRGVIDRLRTENPSLSGATLDLLANQEALTSLMQRHVFFQLARNTGRSVPNEAVAQVILANPDFQDEGRFSKERYEALVKNYFGLTVPGYEARLKDDLLLQNTVSFLQNLSFVPTAYLLETFHFTEDQISLDYAFFPAAAFAQEANPTDEQLATYYEDNSENWRRPAEVQVEYIVFDPNDYLTEAQVTPDEVEALYLEERGTLTTPPVAHISHIQFDFPSYNPTDEEKAAVLKQAQEALVRAETEDFGLLAAELSSDTETAANGGDLGPVTYGTSLPEIDFALFSGGELTEGQLIGPIETVFGYELIKVRSYTPSKVQSLEEATPNLTERLRRRNARNLAIGHLEDLLDRAQKEGTNDLRALARNMGLTSQTSVYFSVNNPPDFLGSSSEETQKAVSQTLGLISEPVQIPSGALLIYVPLDRKESYVPPLTDPETLEQVRASWIATQTMIDASLAAQNLIDTAPNSQDFVEAAAEILGQAQTGIVDFIPRMAIGSAPEPVNLASGEALLMAILELRRPGDINTTPLAVDTPTTKGYLVLSLKDFRPADEAAFQETLAWRRDTAWNNYSGPIFIYWANENMRKVEIRLPQELRAEIDTLTRQAMEQ
ncbi:MAG: SurA N-terminal domain-containing protein [Deltaproteobacteria bacterium]|jgi:peptidyl-prolyl cis-trans isomerase D|nr:SurA N-terminal domain-containing protein [Deltaproteobacteria bacterium]